MARYGTWTLVAVFWLAVLWQLTAKGFEFTPGQETIIVVALGSMAAVLTLAVAYTLLAARPAVFVLFVLIAYLALA